MSVNKEVEQLLNGVSAKHDVGAECPEAILWKSCCYIVAAVLQRPSNKAGKPPEVLMIQEAKPSCRGQWYLPAGRLELNETLAQGAQREVLEESGYEFEPTTLVCVEGSGPSWMRFTFSGQITGGELKTWEDSESIKAQWFPVPEILNNFINLRSKDILPCVRDAMDCKRAVLPTLQPNRHFTLTFLIINPSPESENAQVLLSDDGTLPWKPLINLHHTIPNLALSEVMDMGFRKLQCQPCGILNLSHDATQGGGDGFHLTLVFTTMSGSVPKKGWHWAKLEALGSRVLQTVYSGDIIPYHTIHTAFD